MQRWVDGRSKSRRKAPNIIITIGQEFSGILMASRISEFGAKR